MLSTQSLSPGDFTSDGKHVLLCSTPSEANPRSNRMCKTAPTESTLLQETRVLLNKLNDENRNLRESNSALRAERKLWRQEELNKKHEQEEWKRKVFELQAHLQEKIQQQSDETHAFGVLQRDYDELKESLLRLQEESKTQQAVLCKAHEAIKLLSSNILESTSDDVPDAQAGELLEVIQNVSVSFDSMKRHSSNLKNQIHKHEEQERVLRSENSRLQREIIQLHQAMTNLSQMTSDSSSFLHRMIHPLQDTVVEQQAKIQFLSDILQQLKEFMTSAHLFDHKIAKCVQAERETFQSQILEQNRNLEESRTKCTLQSKRLHDTEKKLRVKEKEHAHAEQRWKTLREQLKDARRVLDDLAGKLEGESQRAIRLQHELHQTQLILTAERAERNALKHECEEQYDTEIASLKKENERIVKDLQGKIEVSKSALDEATLELASLREELRKGKRTVKMLEAVNQTLLDQQHQLLNELGQAEASLLQNHTARDGYSDPQNKVSPHSSPTSSQKVEESILL